MAKYPQHYISPMSLISCCRCNFGTHSSIDCIHVSLIKIENVRPNKSQETCSTPILALLATSRKRISSRSAINPIRLGRTKSISRLTKGLGSTRRNLILTVSLKRSMKCIEFGEFGETLKE